MEPAGGYLLPESFSEIQRALVRAIERADRNGAYNLMETWAQKHNPDRLLIEVLEPTLTWIGEEWRTRESFTIAQSYIAAKITEDALDRIICPQQAAQQRKSGSRPVVIANIEGDFHALGRRMVGIFLRANGWTVHDLGNDVPPRAFVEKALETGARVIGASAMTLTTAREIRRLREEIDRRQLTGRIQLAVGGAVFVVCPEIVEQVGGDGTAASAFRAPKLFELLWDASVQSEKRRPKSTREEVTV